MDDIHSTHSDKAGLAPGSLLHIGEKKISTVKVIRLVYNEREMTETLLDGPMENHEESGVVWLHVHGLHDVDIVRSAGRAYGIHDLTLEDVLNTLHRPKLDEYDEYIAVLTKALVSGAESLDINAEQVTIIWGSGFVLSFQEGGGDLFQNVRSRLKNPKGRIRQKSSDYLAYALLDSVTDNYYGIIESVEERMEAIEEELFRSPSHESLQQLYELRQKVLFLRKSVLPVRDLIRRLIRLDSPLIDHATDKYLRDLGDHVTHISDELDTFREKLAGLMDLYNSCLSNKTNEVMKVLTVIATLFIPMSFVAGVYGMNFKSMPELEWWWGYPMFWGIIVLICLLMLALFKKRGWF